VNVLKKVLIAIGIAVASFVAGIIIELKTIPEPK
jgi:hypothetical protein